MWALQFRSPSICDKPVLFVFSGGGIGVGGGGASLSEDSLNTKSANQEASNSSAGRSGFSKLECLKEFSLHDLNNSGGRLSVAECFLFGVGGGIVIVSAFDRHGSFFNSQEIWGSGLSNPEVPKKKKPASCGAATTIGIWKSEHVGHLVPSRGGVHRSDGSCSIHDLPRGSVDTSLRNYQFPKTVDGPAFRSK